MSYTKQKILNESKDLKISKIEKNKNDKIFDLERQKLKIQAEETRINQDTIKLEQDLHHFNENKVAFIDFNLLKAEINDKKIEIESEIKNLQLYGKELNDIRE
jgi:hypothetical protein